MRRRITRGDFFGLTLQDAMIATVARELEEHQEREAAAAALTGERSKRRRARERGVGPSGSGPCPASWPALDDLRTALA